ncbi:MAG: hypothetical protein ACP5IX_02430 [Patescibacteria group bacterium]
MKQNNFYSLKGFKKRYKKHKKHKKHRYKPSHHHHVFTYLSQTSNHHFIPTSRKGTNDQKNRKQIPFLRHNAWHLLFKNLKPEEVIELIKTKSKEEIIERKRNRNLAWEIIFGYWETTQEQKIEIIKNYWMPKEG